MEGKIKVIIKRPDEEYGHVTNISASLKNLQKTVDGYIETLQIAASTVLIMNEEGMILDLEPNFRIREDYVEGIIYGTVIVVGTDGEDFTDLPISFDAWKALLKRWGN